MKSLWTRLLFALSLLAGGPAAQAAITCTSISSPGVSINYMNKTTASVQTFFTVSCTRASASDPTSVSYDVVVDNGTSPAPKGNRASLGNATLVYDLFANAACTIGWGGTSKISDTISWAGGATGTITRQTSFWGCITTSQNATASGTYSDSVGMTMTYGTPATTVFGAIPVAIYAPALCTVSSRPGPINLSYAAFGPQVAQSTSFSMTCTNGMPYTLATDVPEAVLAGLRYTLALNATSANGTGAPQPYTVTATITAGQAGDCPTVNCTATRTHTLTITY